MSNLAERRGTAAVLFLVLLRIAAASHHGSMQLPRPAKVHIRLSDLAGVPDKIREQAEDTVIALYRKAGLEIDFVNCETGPRLPCRLDPGSSDFSVQILKHRPSHLHGDTTGFAILVPTDKLNDSYAAVSQPAVESAARELDAPVAEVLAASLAHEIGHLLLHSSAHSRNGIMSARMDQRQMRLLERGELTFTPDEAARLISVGD
ncbi:MAG TPA: hypothetical protein VML19_12175 [Verrucomicrobiae bacterium]|nr:hypothetical protein [Verrucomicrobiae bacterium]